MPSLREYQGFMQKKIHKHFFLMAGNGFCFVSVRKGSSNEEGSLERGKLRNKLFNFIKSRPTKESLEQKGIIKGNI